MNSKKHSRLRAIQQDRKELRKLLEGCTSKDERTYVKYVWLMQQPFGRIVKRFKRKMREQRRRYKATMLGERSSMVIIDEAHYVPPMSGLTALEEAAKTFMRPMRELIADPKLSADNTATAYRFEIVEPTVIELPITAHVLPGAEFNPQADIYAQAAAAVGLPVEVLRGSPHSITWDDDEPPKV